MERIWGVNSWNRAHIWPPGVSAPAARWGPQGVPANATLYEYVRRRAAEAPAFWGRYLTSDPRYGLLRDEAEFLHAQGCRILLIYNGDGRGRHQITGAQAFANGQRAAERACELARGVGAAGGVRIYADLEGWRADAAWFRGWSQRMYASPYLGLGGAYGNASASWSWGPGAVDGVEDLGAGSLLSDLAAGRIASRTKQSLFYLWTTRPHLSQDREPPAGRIIEERFLGRGQAGFMLETVLWQYRTNVPLGSDAPIVDLDLATPRGFDEMWHPPVAGRGRRGMP